MLGWRRLTNIDRNYVGLINEMPSRQRHLSMLGQQYCQQNAKVVPTNDWYMGRTLYVIANVSATSIMVCMRQKVVFFSKGHNVWAAPPPPLSLFFSLCYIPCISDDCCFSKRSIHATGKNVWFYDNFYMNN